MTGGRLAFWLTDKAEEELEEVKTEKVKRN
jgi:hypothetical protein